MNFWSAFDLVRLVAAVLLIVLFFVPNVPVALTVGLMTFVIVGLVIGSVHHLSGRYR